MIKPGTEVEIIIKKGTWNQSFYKVPADRIKILK